MVSKMSLTAFVQLSDTTVLFSPTLTGSILFDGISDQWAVYIYIYDFTYIMYVVKNIMCFNFFYVTSCNIFNSVVHRDILGLLFEKVRK